MKGLVLAAFVLVSGAFYAQGKAEKPTKTPEEHAQHLTDKMTEKLALTSDQQAKIKAINLAHAQKAEQLHQDSTLTREQMHTQHKATKDALMAEYKTVLTDEQYKQLEAWHDEKQEHRADAKHEEHEKPTAEEKAKQMTDHMTKKLSLNSDQQTKIAALHLAYAQKHEKIMNDAAVTKEDKKAQLESGKTSLMADYKAVLTTEQYQQLEAWQAQKEERKDEHRGQKGHGKCTKEEKAAPAEQK